MYDMVIIEVRGGVAEAVLYPKNVQVLIRDYDCDGSRIGGSPIEDGVEIDSNGDAYTETCS